LNSQRTTTAYVRNERGKQGRDGGEEELGTGIPLIEFEGEITMTSDPFLVVGIHDCLRGGTNGDGLLEIRVACLGEPGDFGGKSLDVVFFLFEDAFGDEHREVCILNAHLLDLSIEPVYGIRRKKMERRGWGLSGSYAGWLPRRRRTRAS
jgi:hypothetical protein